MAYRERTAHGHRKTPLERRVISPFRKKWSLSFTIGPPSEKPPSFCEKSGKSLLSSPFSAV